MRAGKTWTIVVVLGVAGLAGGRRAGAQAAPAEGRPPGGTSSDETTPEGTASGEEPAVEASPEDAGREPNPSGGDVEGQADGARLEAPDLPQEAARGLFRAGEALYEAGRFVEAAQQFEAAYRLSEAPLLLFNASVAWRDAGEWERSARALRRYLEATPDDVPGRRRLEARLQRLEQRIEALERERALRERLARERLAEQERRTVEGGPTLPWWIAGGGALAMLLGGGAGLLALSARSDLEAGCGGVGCPYREVYDDYEADLSRVRSWSLAADVLLGSGLLLAVGGTLWGLLLGGDGPQERADSEAASSGRTPALGIGLGDGELALRWRSSW